MAQVVNGVTTLLYNSKYKNFSRRIQKKQHAHFIFLRCFKMRNMKFNGGKINGNDWLFAEIDSEKINQLLESTKKP